MHCTISLKDAILRLATHPPIRIADRPSDVSRTRAVRMRRLIAYSQASPTAPDETPGGPESM